MDHQINSSINIRPVLPTDSEVITRLSKQLGYTISVNECMDNIHYFKTLDADIVYVAEIEGAVVGFIALHVMSQFHQIGKLARISALVVDATYRGLGVGQLLVSQAEQVARSQGAHAVEVTSKAFRKATGTYNFYNNLGYYNNGENQKAYFIKII